MDISFVARKFQRSIAGLSLATMLAASVFTGSALGMTFDDVSSDNYAYDSVDWASDAGIMTGYADGTFGRANNLTRQEAAKVLIEAFDLPMDSSDTVTCTGSVDTWAQPYMATANTLGILTGEGDGSCNAAGNVNRAAFAKMVVVAGGFADTGVLGSDVFMDVETSDWFDSYVGQAWSNSIVNGMTSTTFGPGDYIIRADAAVMVDRAVNSAEVRYPETSGDDDDDDTTTTTGGALEVILSNDSPEDYTYFSAGTNAEVATFELTASDEDVVVTSFEVELASGDADSVTALALYNEEGTRISKVDTSIDTDDMARMTMLDGGYTVAAGTSETFRLMNSFVDATTANTSTLYSYAFNSSMVESDASTVEVENGLTTGIFGLLDNNTGAITVDDVDVASDVQVGETDTELFSFEISESSNDKDVWLTAITFENDTTATANLEDAVDDVALYFDGDWVSDGTVYGDYISFQMDSDVAPLIEAGNTESLEVRARIIGESGETLVFGIDETLDVRAVDEDDNDVAVTSTFATGSTDIEAGAVSVVAYDAESDKFRADREDVELGRFEVTAGTSGLTLNTVNVEVVLTDADSGADAEVWAIEDLFENFTVELNGAKNYLDPTAPYDADVMYGVDVDKSLTEGTVYEFVVYADTLSVDAAETASGNTVEDYTDFAVEISLNSLGTPAATTDGLVVEEDATGDLVGDFTPSSVTFNSLQGETAGVDIAALSLSSAKNVVVGGEELGLEFQVQEAADVSDLVIKDLNVTVLVDEDADATYAETGESADNTNVRSVDLYQVGSDGTETLLDSVSGSNLGALATDGNSVNFDFNDITVAQNSDETFRVYVSFVDDEALNAHKFKVALLDYDIRDDENNVVYDAADSDTNGDYTGADTPPSSGRIMTLVSTGALYVEVDNDDDTYGTQSPRFIQNGTDAAGLMTLALRSVNEDVTVEDYTLTLSAGSIKEMFTKFYIYDENGVLIGDQTVTSETTDIDFTDVDTELTAYADVTTRYYVVADTTSYGLNQIGTADANTTANRTWTMAVTTAQGDESGNDLSLNNNGGDSTLESGEIGYGSTTAGARAGDDGATATDASEGFGMATTLISNVEFVSTYGGKTVNTSLNEGPNNVAIIAITVDDTTNTESTGDDVKVDLDSLVVQYTKLAGTTIDETYIERIGGSEGQLTGTEAADTVDQKTTFTLSWTTDNLIVPGTTAYFLVKADVTKDATLDNDDYVQFSLRDFKGTDANYASNFAWKDFASATANVAVYVGTTNSIEGTLLSE